MAHKIEKEEIEGVTYIVTQFGAKRGRVVLFRLTKMLGSAMAGLVEGVSFKDLSFEAADLDSLTINDISGLAGALQGGISSALTAWVQHAREEDFEFLCDAFAENTKIVRQLESSNGGEIELDLAKQFDSHFAGKYGSMILWLAFAIRVNFSDFLSEIARALKGKLAAIGLTRKPSNSKSPPA